MIVLTIAEALRILRKAVASGQYRPGSKQEFDHCLDLCGEGYIEEDDQYAGLYRPTVEGERALERWDNIPAKVIH